MRPESDRKAGTPLLAPWRFHGHWGIVFLRLGLGAMMLAHGAPKLDLLLSGGGEGWVAPFGGGGPASLAACCFAEFFCSLALIAGFFARPAALVLALHSAVVLFTVGEAAGGARFELSMLYLMGYVTLFVTGAGRLSADRFIRRRCRRCQGAGSVLRSSARSSDAAADGATAGDTTGDTTGS